MKIVYIPLKSPPGTLYISLLIREFLSNEPALIIGDEPMGNVDDETAREIPDTLIPNVR